MIDKYREIFQSWIESLNPSDLMKDLSGERLEICLSCDKRREIIERRKWSAYCQSCGCPINKKIFSPIFNSCPEKKWEFIDSKYLEPIEDKEEKTLI